MSNLRALAVATYRLYLLQPGTHSVVGYKEFDASTDELAIRIASGFIGEHEMDLWTGVRKVRRFLPFDQENGAA